MSTQNRNTNMILDDINIDKIDADFNTVAFVEDADIELDVQAQQQDASAEADVEVENENENENENEQGQLQGQQQAQQQAQDTTQTQGTIVANENGDNDNSTVVRNDIDIDFGEGEWIPRDDDFIDIDMEGSAEMGDVLGVNGDYDPGNDLSMTDVLNDLTFGDGNSNAFNIGQSNNLVDNDTLNNPTVANNDSFEQNGDARGGTARAEEGINAASVGGEGGGDADVNGGDATGG